LFGSLSGFVPGNPAQHQLAPDWQGFCRFMMIIGTPKAGSALEGGIRPTRQQVKPGTSGWAAVWYP
jgi:hypothetical protein